MPLVLDIIIIIKYIIIKYYCVTGIAPYVNCSQAIDRRHGWSSLVVTQVSTNHHMFCSDHGPKSYNKLSFLYGTFLHSHYHTFSVSFG